MFILLYAHIENCSMKYDDNVYIKIKLNNISIIKTEIRIVEPSWRDFLNY